MAAATLRSLRSSRARLQSKAVEGEALPSKPGDLKKGYQSQFGPISVAGKQKSDWEEIVMRSSFSSAAVAAALLIGSAAPVCARNIYSFPADVRIGAVSPSSDLTADAAGNLYGLTPLGGSSGDGTVFRLVPPAAKGQPWTEQTLYSFVRAVSGIEPEGKPLLDAAGNVYGVSLGGGTGGDGTVWKLSPPVAGGGPWTLAVLHPFTNPTHYLNGGLGGASPWAGLVMDRSGTLYGTTADGGTYGWGVAFSLTPPAAGGTVWTETVLHNFGGENNGGQLIDTPLTLADHDSTLIGLSPFLSIPQKGLADPSGLVYRLRRSGDTWTYAVIHRFDATKDPGAGYGLVGGVVIDRNNNVFGVTTAGGASKLGTVFELSPPAPGQTAWTEQVLHSFAGSDGESPSAGLVAGPAPALFGTTVQGGQGGAADGSSGSDGVVFRLDPPASGRGSWTYTALHAFDASGSAGKYKYKGQAGDIQTGLTFGPHRFLFGVATYGGLYDSGTVFAQTPH